MAKEIIEKVLDIEKNCEKSIQDAKSQAENIKTEAKINSKSYYDLEIKKAQENYVAKIEDAKKQAKNAIDDAANSSETEKGKLIEKVKGNQEKAIKSIIDSLV